MEGVRHFTIRLGWIFRQVPEDFDATASHYALRKLGFTPADVHGGCNVEEQISCDSTGIIPVFTETEEAVCSHILVPVTLGRITEPHLPVDVVIAFAIRTGTCIDRPVPFTFNRVSVIATLAHDMMAEHSFTDHPLGLMPLITGCGLRTDL